MLEYRTVDEKAQEWGLSPRSIQAMCRAGKIEGAVKRAGSWFIPETYNPHPGPAEDEGYLMFSGTKGNIFRTAIELFGKYSYDIVSIKDIADNVGIRQSAVYNHFASKQEMLDTIYAFFRHYFLSTRPTPDDLEPLLREGSVIDILKSIIYDFEPTVQGLMLSITKIISQRRSIDDQAREIALTLMLEGGEQYCETIFDRAVAIGRLAPFDTHLLSIFFNSLRLYVLWSVLLDPSETHVERILADQEALTALAAGHLTDLGKQPSG